MSSAPKPKAQKKQRGGARVGAGRRAGIPNKASVARQRQVEATGATPHDVQLIRMRYYANKFGECVTRGQQGGPGLMVDGRVITTVLTEYYLDKAGDAADAAAPYVHPRLSAIAIRDFEAWKRAQDAEREQGGPVIDGEVLPDLTGKSESEILALIRSAIGEDAPNEG